MTDTDTTTKEAPYLYTGKEKDGKAPNVAYIRTSPFLKEVPDEAFYKLDNLVDIVFTKNITHIGYEALYRCSKLENVTIEDESSLRSIGGSAFYECPKIVVMKLPPSLETLGGGAFFYCTGLKKATLSPQMSTIQEGTFSRCSSL